MALGRLALALLGVLARDKISTWLGNATQPAGDPTNPSAGGSIFDTISKTFGTDGGLRDVLDRFRNAGSGDKVDSWVKDGPSEGLEPHQVEAAVDEATLTALSQQTGLSREELLRRLAPGAAPSRRPDDPEGRLPDEAGATEREPT